MYIYIHIIHDLDTVNISSLQRASAKLRDDTTTGSIFLTTEDRHRFSLVCLLPQALQSFSEAIQTSPGSNTVLCQEMSRVKRKLYGFQDSLKRLRWIGMLFHAPEAL